MNYVIIGNSAAAVGAIESIRAIDQKGSITVVSEEKEHVYSSVDCALLAGDVTEERMPYRSADFYINHDIKTYLGIKLRVWIHRLGHYSWKMVGGRLRSSVDHHGFKGHNTSY